MTDTICISRRFPHNSDALEFVRKYRGYAKSIDHYGSGPYWNVDVRITPENLDRLQADSKPTWTLWNWLTW
jgi:hypothetical protein